MSHEISYAGLDEEAKAAKALEDIKFYLGPQGFAKVNAIVKELPTQGQFEFALEFVGVRGYPVVAWWEELHGKGSWQD